VCVGVNIHVFIMSRHIYTQAFVNIILVQIKPLLITLHSRPEMASLLQFHVYL
jgi:hypothetical protein